MDEEEREIKKQMRCRLGDVISECPCWLFLSRSWGEGDNYVVLL